MWYFVRQAALVKQLSVPYSNVSKNLASVAQCILNEKGFISGNHRQCCQSTLQKQVTAVFNKLLRLVLNFQPHYLPCNKWFRTHINILRYTHTYIHICIVCGVLTTFGRARHKVGLYACAPPSTASTTIQWWMKYSVGLHVTFCSFAVFIYALYINFIFL